MYGWGFGHGFISIMGGMFFAMIWMLCFIVVVGVLFLLVRFLLVGTRAAQLYVAKNEPPRPAAAKAAPAAAKPATASETKTPAKPASTASQATKASAKGTPKAAPKKP